MSSLLRFSCTLLAVIISTAPGFALTWQAQTIRLELAPFQKIVEAEFRFQNDSEQPLAILDVQTSCDCLLATPDQKIYPPGANGIIRGKFTAGDRIGLYERRITVLTDASENPVQLVLQIEVPAVATVSPQSLAWTTAEPTTEKTTDIEAASGLEITFSEVHVTNDDFTARLESVIPGRHYRLHVRPRQAGQRANAAIRISGREKSGHEVLVSAYANVQ